MGFRMGIRGILESKDEFECQGESRIRIRMDLYLILGVQHGATDADIKRAYRRLARRFHPDINPGDRTAEARFRQILEAYETLIDPSRRQRYDLGFGPEPESDRRPPGFEGFDFSTRGSDHSGTFGDLVAEVPNNGTVAA